MKSKLTAVVLIAAQLAMTGIGAVRAAGTDGTLIVEGENYFRITGTSKIDSAASLSGGKSLSITIAKDKIPKLGSEILYKIQAQSEGWYYMHMTCPTIGAKWISPCAVRINDGDYQMLGSMSYEQTGTLNGTGVSNNHYNMYKLKPVLLKKGVNDIYLKLPYGTISTGKIEFRLDCIKFEPMLDWEFVGFETDMPANVYEQKDNVNPKLNFTFADKQPHKIYYRVEDYFGNVIAEEETQLRNSREYYLKFDKKLETGHYTVYIAIDDVEIEKEYYFSVVKNFDERDVSANTHFMVDVVANQLLQLDDAESHIRALRLAGVTSARERYQWSRYQSEAGVIDHTWFDAYRDIYEENGIHVMSLPAALPELYKTDGHKIFPGNLLEVYNHAKMMGETYGGQLDIEAWNEPDNKDDAPDWLAAYMKALAIGARDGNPEATTIGPGICVMPGYYTDVLAQNEVMDYMDAFAFHYHRGYGTTSTNVTPLPERAKPYDDAVKRYGYEDKYIYNTEAGMSLPTNPTADDALKKQARYCATSMLTTASMGIDRHYWFIWSSYLERGVTWGNFTSDDMPFSAYNVLAAMTDIVGEAKYIGSLDVGEEVTCLVFENRGKHVAAIWSENATSVKIPTSQNEAELVNIMGVSSKILNSNGGFDIISSPDVQYVKLDGKFDKYKDVVYQEKQVEKKQFTKAERVVLQQIYPEDTIIAARGLGYSVSGTEPTTVKVRAVNLNDTQMTGVISGNAYGSWQLSPASQEITIEPFAAAELSFTLTPGEGAMPGVAAPVTFEGTFGSEKTSRSAVSIAPPFGNDVEPNFLLEGYDEPSNWSKNITDGGTDEHVKEEDGVMSIKYVFPPESPDNWVYPKFEVAEGSLAGTAGLVYEIYFEETPPPGVELRAFAYEREGGEYFTSGAIPVELKAGWNRVAVPWSRFSLRSVSADFTFNLETEEIVAISIGMNLKKGLTETEHKIRNLGAFYQPETDIHPSIDNLTCEINANKVSISAVLTEHETDIQPGSVKLLIDNEWIDVQVIGSEATASFIAEQGTHEGFLRLADNTGKVIFKTISFEIE